MNVINKNFNNKKFGVLGLGISGVSAVKFLKSVGYEVCAWDDSEETRTSYRALKINIIDLNLESNLKNIDILLVSPGVSLNHNILICARKLGITITNDMDIFWTKELYKNNKFIAVSGSNGKSTVSSLIHHIMKFSGLLVQLGGNIGIPVLDLLPFKRNGTFVLEISSYQLDLMINFRASTSVLTNISPDHLDHHGSLDNYIFAKEKLFQNQSSGDFAVINVDNDYCRILYEKLYKIDNPPKLIAVSQDKKMKNSVYYNKNILIDFTGEKKAEIGNIEELTSLKGRHNRQNIACAVAACLINGVSYQNIKKGLSSFKTLPHRMEEVAIIKNITFVNDSKATNLDSTLAALRCYEEVIWIAGGQGKKENLGKLKNLKNHILAGFFIGTSGEKFRKFFENYFLVKNSISLIDAVNDSVNYALKLEHPVIILFSPGCASFDQFKNFEIRGETFRSEINKIKNNYLDHEK